MSKSETSSFLSYLEAKRPLVDAWLEEHSWKLEGGPTSDLESFLYRPLARYTAAGGKRVRPVLALLGAEATGGQAEQALAAGCAVELFQSAALIHDDIADAGELRRGEPCLHLTEGLGIAINIGDAALIQASDAILAEPGLEDHTRVLLMRELVAMQRRTIEGQALDLGWARDGRWDIDYTSMALLKTAHYSAASPLVLGALCNNAIYAQVEGLRSFGLDAGLAFQLQDDLLNLVGEAEAQGKDFRSDITEGKRTLVASWAIEHLGERDSARLQAILNSGTTEPQELAEAVALMDKADAIEHVRALAARLAEKACEHLDAAPLEDESCEILKSMAHFFVERNS